MIFLGILVTTHDPLLGVLTLWILFLLPSLLEPIFTSLLNEHFPDEARATALSGVSLLGSTTRVILRPGIGYLADLNILNPFRLDFLVVGLSSLAVLFFGKAITGKSLAASLPADDPDSDRRSLL